MSQETSKTFIDEINSNEPKQIYNTKKTDVCHTDDIWSLDILDLKDYGPENNRNYRFIFVAIDNLFSLNWLDNPSQKNAQTIKDFFENILITSKS